MTAKGSIPQCPIKAFLLRLKWLSPIIAFIGIFFCAISPCKAQERINPVKNTSPYRITLKTDIPLILGSGISFWAGIRSMQRTTPVTYTEAMLLNTEDAFRFDRSAVNNRSLFANDASDYILFGSLAVPLTLMAFKKPRKDFLTVGLMATEMYMLTAGLTNMTKGLVQRKRPFVFDPNTPVDEKLTTNASNSFVSGHTSMTAASTFFFAKVLTDYNPNMRFKGLLWTGAATIPAVVGYMRYKAGRHFLTDVLGGYALGALVGYFVPHFHKVRAEKVNRKVLMNFNAGMTGMQFGMRF